MVIPFAKVQKKMHKYKKNEQKFIFRLVFSVFGLRRVAVYRAPAKLCFVGRGRIAVVQCRKRQSIRQAYSDDEVGEYDVTPKSWTDY